ncbi:MAG: hypothetical protein UHD05_07760, partial [Ruminococcus sp.]|nr:hypothetical protein [Ruminococcus sp.]
IIKGNFTLNIISRALPAALCVIFNVIAVAIISPHFSISEPEFSTISVYMTALSCILLVVRLSLPLNALRSAMLVVCSLAVVIGCVFFGQFFSLASLSFEGIIILIAFAVGTIIVFNLLYSIAEHYIKKFKKQG